MNSTPTNPSTNQPPMKSAVEYPPMSADPLDRLQASLTNREAVQRRTGFTSMADDYASQLHSLIQLRATRHELAETVKPLVDALRDLLFALENADETGYVTDVGFVDLEKIYATAHVQLAHFDAAQGAQKEKL